MIFKGAGVLWYITMFINIIRGFLGLFSIYLLKLIADKSFLNNRPFDIQDILNLNRHELIVLFLLVIILLVIRISGKILREQNIYRISNNLYSEIHKHCLRMDINFYENSSQYEKLHRALSECSYRPAYLINNSLNLIRNVFTILLAAGVIIYLNKYIIIILFLAVIPAYLVRTRISSAVYNNYKKHTFNERTAEYYNQLLTEYGFAMELRLFDLGLLLNTRFFAKRQLIHIDRIRLLFKSEIYSILSTILGAFIIAAGCSIFLRTAIFKNDLGNVVLLIGSIYKVFNSINSVFISLSSLNEDKMFISSLADFFSIKPVTDNCSDKIKFPEDLNAGINIKNLEFSYPESFKKVLENINLSIVPGEITAFAGKNGSGKSSLIKLLCKYYLPDSGSIFFGETDIKNIKASILRQNLSVLIQDYKLFYLSVCENIWFGNIREKKSLLKIKKAAAYTGSDKIISEFKTGFSTILGKNLDKGVEISKGEYQKLALSRCFFRNSIILILDEPCSSVDPYSEQLIFEHLKRIKKNRIIILITHKPAGLEIADKVVFFSNNTINDIGTHKFLKTNNKLYQKLFEFTKSVKYE